MIGTDQGLDPMDPMLLRQAFGTFPTGVVAVAASVEGSPVGLAASSFTTVSLDPPLVSVNLATTSSTWPVLRGAGRLGVTVLADHQDRVCRQLAGEVAHRFDDVDWSATEHGAVLLDQGLARFECTVYREVEAGDHVLVLLRLQAVEQAAAEAATSPLVFHRSGFGRLEQEPG